MKPDLLHVHLRNGYDNLPATHKFMRNDGHTPITTTKTTFCIHLHTTVHMVILKLFLQLLLYYYSYCECN